VPRILAALPEKYWTIVTSATEKLARSRLGYAGLAVPNHIITADMVTDGKPHPEPYLKGAALLGLKAEDCLVIEDSSSGAIAGHAAGCKVLATLFSHTTKELAAADWIVQSLEDVTVRPKEDGVEIEFEPVFQKK
jgi:sugar-phosphatase